MAEGTLNRSAEVLQTVTPISTKVEEWANNMRNNEYSADAYERAISSAGEAGKRVRGTHVFLGCYKDSQWANRKCVESTFSLNAPFSSCFAVENLNVLVPELLDKLKVVEEKKPVNNVTTNIMRIRELIAQARSVAKKVSNE